MPLLEPLRVGLCHAQPLHHVARHVRAGEFDRREVADLPLVEDRHARRAPADLDQRDAQLPLVVRQHGVRGRQRFEHQVGGAVAGPLDALAQVLRGGRLHRDEVHLDLEPRARHPHRIRNALLLIDLVLLRDVVQQLVVPAQRNGARHLVHARHVFRRDLVARHRHHAGRDARRDVLPRDAAGHRAHLHTRHPLGIAHGGDDGPARLVDIAHHTAAHARVLREPHPQHLGERLARDVPHHLGDHGARLGAAEIEPGHDLPIPAHAPPSPAPSAVALRRTITWPAKRASSST